MIKIQRAVVSVYDKSGLEELVRALHAVSCEIVSTGGTARFIQQLGIPCETVKTVTGFPEILEGRVKTLHPKIFAALLARQQQSDKTSLEQHGITPIQLVVNNLYPFHRELADHGRDLQHMMEFVDIGGVAMLRAAAKNHSCCVVLSDPTQYPPFLSALQANHGAIPSELSGKFAAAAVNLTATYDAQIGSYLIKRYVDQQPLDTTYRLDLVKELDLAYGENPHQRAALYRDEATLLEPEQLGGKPLSYNNLLDLDGCLGVLSEYRDETACVIVKHSNPCGIAIAPQGSLDAAFDLAMASDSISAFGGVVGFTQPVDLTTAEKLHSCFFEVIAAPGFDAAALQQLKRKKKVRLLQVALPLPSQLASSMVVHSTLLGYLVQQRDAMCEDLQSAKVVTARQPNAAELRALQFSWKACKWVKSNAIVIASDKQTLGIGAGQMSRVDAVKIAVDKASSNHAHGLAAAVLASDAFFPFRDSIDLAHSAGIRAVVQPGGSIRDDEVIEAANEHDMTMIFTGARHFRH